MKKVVNFSIAMAMALVMLSTVSIESQASTQQPGYFDFEQQVIKMDAGTTRQLRVVNNYDYTYYLGPHTSAATYMECSFKKGTEYVTLHIGPDETVKNVFFYFYVDDKSLGVVEIQDCIEVYVQKIDPAAVQKVAENTAAQNALRNFSGNTAEFNALYYYYNYQDLRDAFGMDPVKLLEHYNTFGKNEKRVANRMK